MKLSDSIEIALTNIMHQKLRSWLTVLGIVIGVAAIITLISISVGMQQNIQDATSSFGANNIIVSAGSERAARMGGFGGEPSERGSFGGESSGEAAITFKEANELRFLAGISVLDAQLQERAEVTYKDKNTSLSIIGADPEDLPEILNVELEDGHYPTAGDKYSAVLGYNVAHSVFNDDEEENLLNKQIVINGIMFKVVGILEESGGMQGSDRNIYIPIEAAKDIFDEDENADQLVIIVKEGYDVNEVASDIEEELRSMHGLLEDDESDFQVTTATSVQSAVSSISDTLALFLGGIASISLLVGGIGVLNTMFMSVMEQTRTIGVLKALGAKDGDIIGLFLIEAATLGLIGGFAGVGLSFFASIVLSMLSLPTVISAELVALGLLFSVLVGIIAGLVPARNAASVSPVEALKYE